MTFFNIPIQKLLDKLPEKYKNDENFIEFNISQKEMIQGLEENRFWVHIAARRTGKSFSASVLALAKLLEPGMFVTVVAPNFTLSSIIWDYVTEFIRELQIETEKFNQKDRVVKLINGSVFRLLSANNRDALVGRGINLLIIDEAAVIDDEEYFTRDLRPALSTFDDSRALFITTPRGKANYTYKYYLRGTDEKLKFPDWGGCVHSWKANPLLSLEDIEEAKLTLPDSLYQQEYECKFTIFEGQIYNIDEEIHLQDLSRFEEDDDRYFYIAGLDIGYRDSTAFIVIITDEENFYIVDCYSSSQSTTSAHAEIIQELIDKWGIENIYIDSANQQFKADLAYEYDIYTENAVKSVLDGIAAVQVLIEQKKLLIDINNANPVFKALAAYRWNNKTEKQKPMHDWSCHYADAVRYGIYSFLRKTSGIYAST